MTTLVTGATGFIGKHLARTLVEQGRDVRCLVRRTSDTKYLEELGVELFYADLLNKSSLSDVFRNIDIVHHLASEVYSKKASEFYRNNILGTKNLLEACSNESIKKFIYLSSIAVNGISKNQHLLINEESPCYPFNPYGRSKLEAEKLILNYSYQYDVPIAIIRAPVVYGPGQPYILTKIFHRISKAKPVYIVGTGNNLRSLCYIDNLIQGILLAENNADQLDSVYVVSDKKAYTLNEIMQAIIEVMKVNIRIFYLPFLTADIAKIIFYILLKVFRLYSLSLYSILTMKIDLGCDISRSEKQLGYKPQIEIKEGIKRTFDWYQDNLM